MYSSVEVSFAVFAFVCFVLITKVQDDSSLTFVL